MLNFKLLAQFVDARLVKEEPLLRLLLLLMIVLLSSPV